MSIQIIYFLRLSCPGLMGVSISNNVNNFSRKTNIKRHSTIFILLELTKHQLRMSIQRRLGDRYVGSEIHNSLRHLSPDMNIYVKSTREKRDIASWKCTSYVKNGSEGSLFINLSINPFKLKQENVDKRSSLETGHYSLISLLSILKEAIDLITPVTLTNQFFFYFLMNLERSAGKCRAIR